MSPEPTPRPELRFMRLQEVLAKTACTRSEFYRKIADGVYPPPRKDGRKAFWVLHEIEAAMEAHLAALGAAA